MQNLLQFDHKHIWHPCSQMKDFETTPPLIVNQAKGAYLYTNQGEIIDAISSWWCKSLGHGHPNIINAIQAQLNRFEHVIGANTTHDNIIELAQKLADITTKQHAFFASDGSCAIEIAMKLTIHAHLLRGKNKNKFLAFANGYHGETLAALNVSDLDIYAKPYQGFGPQCYKLKSIPYIFPPHDALSSSNYEWQVTLDELEANKEELCAIIFEPLVQGAGGMRCYNSSFLQQVVNWCKANDVYIIADEIMTGFGRLGSWLASDLCSISPDIICLSKGLTAGSIPFSVVMIDSSIYNLFYDDYNSGKAFLHSHTFSGNALGAAAALAAIKTLEEEQLITRAKLIQPRMFAHLTEIAKLTDRLINVRALGAIAAAEITPIANEPRLGYKLFQTALKKGALLRPLGNTLYWMPPLNIDFNILDDLADITLAAIREI